LRYRKTKQQLVDDNEQAARIALYLPQLHAQKEKLEADLQELEHLALSGWGYGPLSMRIQQPAADMFSLSLQVVGKNTRSSS
jgi:hypothetical protein